MRTITDERYNRWLNDLSVPRIILVELDHSGGTEYLASAPYVTYPDDEISNQVYDDILQQAVDIETRIDSKINFGEIVLTNDGKLDSWISKAWKGYEIRIYIGSPHGHRDDFRLHARGINDGISQSKRGKLSFLMIDSSSKLDEVIDTGRLPDDAGPVPLLFGFNYNVPAYRTDDSTSYTYKISYLPLTGLLFFDGGAKVSAYWSPDSDQTAIYVNQTVVQQASAQASINTLKYPNQVIQWVADYYNIEIAECNLYNYTLSLYYNSDVTGKQILDDICTSFNAYWYLNELNQLVVKREEIKSTADVVLVDDDIFYDGVTLTDTIAPLKSLTFRYSRNYQVLSQVAGSVEDSDAAEAARFKREWSEIIQTQNVDIYKTAENTTINSCLYLQGNANSEAQRQLSYNSNRFDVYEIDCFIKPVVIGQTIYVDHPMIRRNGIITSVNRSPTKSRTRIRIKVINNDIR